MISSLQPIMQRPNYMAGRAPTTGETPPPKCEKPPLSYQTLIARAIMNAGGSFTLAGIYSYIMELHVYFRTTQDNWRNRVRHTLTVCKSFKRLASSSSRRGGLWIIDPNFRDTFTLDWTYVGANNRTYNNNLACANSSKCGQQVRQQNIPLNIQQQGIQPNLPGATAASGLPTTNSHPATPDTTVVPPGNSVATKPKPKPKVNQSPIAPQSKPLLMPTYTDLDAFNQAQSANNTPAPYRSIRMRDTVQAPNVNMFAPNVGPWDDFITDNINDFNANQLSNQTNYTKNLELHDMPDDFGTLDHHLNILDQSYDPHQPFPVDPVVSINHQNSTFPVRTEELQRSRMQTEDVRSCPYTLSTRNNNPSKPLHTETIENLCLAQHTTEAADFTALAMERLTGSLANNVGDLISPPINGPNMTFKNGIDTLESPMNNAVPTQYSEQAPINQDLGPMPKFSTLGGTMGDLDTDFSMMSLSQLGDVDGFPTTNVKTEPGIKEEGQGTGEMGGKISLFSLDDFRLSEGGDMNNLQNMQLGLDPFEVLDLQLQARESVDDLNASLKLAPMDDRLSELPALQAFRLDGPKTSMSMENFNKVLKMLKSENEES